MAAKTKLNPNLISLMIFAGLLGLWEILSRLGIISATFFPPPSKIWDAFITLLSNGELLTALQATFLRYVSGVLVGSLAGVILGLIMGWWPKVNDYLAPWIAAMYPIPKIAIFPLLMVIFGIGEGSKFVAIMLSCFFPMLITTLAGVQQINRNYFEIGKNYGIEGKKIFTHILFPGSLPSILAGLRLAANTGFILAISVEVISAKAGLGVLLWFSWQTFRVSHLYVILIIISLLGIGLNYLIGVLSNLMLPWMGD